MNTKIDIDVIINRTISNTIKDDVYRALMVGAEALLTESNRTVPKDDGILKASGKVSGDKNLMTTAVSYDTPYAARLHEHPEYNFQGTGRGKWLELTLFEKRNELQSLIAKTIKASIDQGGGI